MHWKQTHTYTLTAVTTKHQLIVKIFCLYFLEFCYNRITSSCEEINREDLFIKKTDSDKQTVNILYTDGEQEGSCLHSDSYFGSVISFGSAASLLRHQTPRYVENKRNSVYACESWITCSSSCFNLGFSVSVKDTWTGGARDRTTSSEISGWTTCSTC